MIEVQIMLCSGRDEESLWYGRLPAAPSIGSTLTLVPRSGDEETFRVVAVCARLHCEVRELLGVRVDVERVAVPAETTPAPRDRWVGASPGGNVTPGGQALERLDRVRRVVTAIDKRITETSGPEVDGLVRAREWLIEALG